ncbi:Adhesion G protein-coupled receptor L3 [Trichoplax sp. H2]|nr:Adhesion G protein-coupled receptor L3 [Trichoplax sp. H2]|eukprot:RDD36871.1 Adhesion G protein-coupled receptor L3 [Trichoplax sp. H2]
MFIDEIMTIDTLTILCLILTILNSTAMNGQEVCTPGWTKISNRCFKSFEIRTTYGIARSSCQQMSGDLAVDDSVIIHNALYNLLLKHKPYWIGLEKRYGDNLTSDYRWLATGQSVIHGPQFWANSNPVDGPDRCVFIIKVNGFHSYWRNKNCSYLHRYICQKSAEEVSLSSIPVVSISVENTDPPTTELNPLYSITSQVDVGTSKIDSSSPSITLSSNTNIFSSPLPVTSTSVESKDASATEVYALTLTTSQVNIETSEIASLSLSITLSSNSNILASTVNKLESSTSTDSNNNIISSLYEDAVILSSPSSDFNVNISASTDKDPLISSASSFTLAIESLTSIDSKVYISSSADENPLISSISSSVFILDHNLRVVLTVNTAMSDSERFTSRNEQASSSSRSSNNALLTTSELSLLASTTTDSFVSLSMHEDLSTSIVDKETFVLDSQNLLSSLLTNSSFDNVIMATTAVGSQQIPSTTSGLNINSTTFEDSLRPSILSSNFVINSALSITSATPTVIIAEKGSDAYNQLVISSSWINSNSEVIQLSTATNHLPLTAYVTLQSHISSSINEYSLMVLIIDDIITNDASVTVTNVKDEGNATLHQQLSSNSSMQSSSTITIDTPTIANNSPLLSSNLSVSDPSLYNTKENLLSSLSDHGMTGDYNTCITCNNRPGFTTMDIFQHPRTLSVTTIPPLEYSTSSSPVSANITLNQSSSADNESYIANHVKASKMIDEIQETNSQLIVNITDTVDKNPGLILTQIDKFDTNLAKKINQANITTQFRMSTPQSELVAQTIKASNTKSTINLVLSSSNKSVAEVRIPKSAFQFSDQDHTVTVVVRTYNVERYWAENNANGNNSIIISSILSCSVYPPQDKNFTVPVHLHFKIQYGQTYPPYRCAYWEQFGWSEYGIQLLGYNSTRVHCATSHFTSFAALTGPHDANLRYITYAGYSASLFALLVMITILISSKKFYTVKHFIHLNLAVAMVISIIGFLAGIHATQLPLLCTIIAVGLHFFYLASLTWMMMEALLLLQKISSMRKTIDLKIRRLYFIAGWLPPAVIVAVATCTGIDAYRNSNNCWIKNASPQMWFFVGPIILIVVSNIAITITAVKALFSITVMVQKSEIQKFKVGIRAVTSLIFLFGVSWLFGILYYATDNIAFAYLFTVLNCPQGLLIFYFHCFRDHDVQEYFQKRTKFGTMIFPMQSMRDTSGETRSEDTRASRNVKIPLLPLSTDNISCNSVDIRRDSKSLNKIQEMCSSYSVTTMASVCDHSGIWTNRKKSGFN